MEPLDEPRCTSYMRRSLLAVAAASALFFAAGAEAKFDIVLVVEPARPVAGNVVRVTMRTEIVLPKEHGMRLNVVGPWRDQSGHGFFDARLVRTGPRTFTARFRFPYAGRWRLIVPNWGAPGSAFPPPVDRPVRVRSRR
jgi:hypothetical protein